MKEHTIVYLDKDFEFNNKTFRVFSRELDKHRVDKEVILSLKKGQYKKFKKMIMRDYTSPDGLLYVGYLNDGQVKKYKIYGRTYIIKKNVPFGVLTSEES